MCLLSSVLLAVIPAVGMADLLANQEIEHDGKERAYDLWVPAGAGAEPLPLLVDIHGWTSLPSQQRDWSGYDLFADDERMYVAWPAGISQAWNTVLGNEGEDDVGFILAMVEAIAAEYAIDADRIYVSGFSKGGDLTIRLACEASDTFAAVAVLAGTMIRGAEERCRPSRPIPILIFRGVNDNILPYNGGVVGDPYLGQVDTMSAAEHFEFWRTTNGCSAERDVEQLGPETACATARGCNGGVQTTACDIAGVKRPSTTPHVFYFNTDELDLGRITWEFFKPKMLQDAGNPFRINPGHADAWYNPDTVGQGFFITVFAELGVLSLAWFTYDTELPPNTIDAIIGDPGHRWLTAVGTFDGSTATLDVFNTSGGIFDRGTPRPSDEAIGTITLNFNDCESGEIDYAFPGLGLSGLIPIQRVALDNVALCRELAGAMPEAVR